MQLMPDHLRRYPPTHTPILLLRLKFTAPSQLIAAAAAAAAAVSPRTNKISNSLLILSLIAAACPSAQQRSRGDVAARGNRAAGVGRKAPPAASAFAAEAPRTGHARSTCGCAESAAADGTAPR